MPLAQQLESLTGQLAYVTCRFLTNLAAWERKEYEALAKDYRLKIAAVQCAIEYQAKYGV